MVPKATASALAAILLLTACGGAVQAPEGAGDPEPPAAKSETPALFYHILIRSFADSNGDRHGDLRGIIARLDYLKSLGVTGILLAPLDPAAYPVADSNQPGDGVSMTEQDGDPDSRLNTYRALSTVRAANPALALGSTEVLSQQGDAVLLAHRSQEQIALVIAFL